MRVRCRHCSVKFHIRECDAGKRGLCPNPECKQPFLAPPLPTSSEPQAQDQPSPKTKPIAKQPRAEHAESLPTRQSVNKTAPATASGKLSTPIKTSEPVKKNVTAPPAIEKPVSNPSPPKSNNLKAGSFQKSIGKKKSKKSKGKAGREMVILRWSLTALLASFLIVIGVIFFQRGDEPASQQLVAAEKVGPSSTFEGDVQPFLTKYCADCHGPDLAEGELNFAAYTDQKMIVEHRDEWSDILKILKIKAMPPSDAEQPEDAERDKVVEWLDHQLFFVDCQTAHDPGRITLNRLNRTEYNNTVRDLLGVEFQPAANFPSDDVGYGFDNIGDVLSVPPLLIEKYLDAAEAIASQAIPLKHPSHSERFVVGHKLKEEGSASDGPEDSKVMPSTGKVFDSFEFKADGRYKIRIEAFQDQAGDEPSKMEVRIANNLVDVKEVKDHHKRQTFEMITDAKAGKYDVSAAFINDYYDKDFKDEEHRDRNLYVSFIEVSGPIDMLEGDYRADALVSVTPQEGVNAAEAARVNLQQFLPRAFRRPVTNDEVNQYVKFVELATEQGESFRGSMQIALQAILISPHFLFRVEDGRRQDGPHEVIDDYALASRLSYFLWSTMPDDELLELAGQNKLHDPDVLRHQTERMLHDPKVEELVNNFSGQWLGLRRLTTNEVAPDPKLFPNFDDNLRKDFWKETELFFGSVVLSNRSIYDLLTGKYTFLNERLAKFYGIDGVTGEGFRKVDLKDYPRAGVMTQGSILTLTSYPNRTSPVKRGQWVLENLLGDAPPDPPPTAPSIEETQDANPNLSFREQLVLHRADPGCASCHVVMDEIGFGLQNFDAIGQWRDKEDGHPVDASGKLPTGETFVGPTELVTILSKRHTDFGKCLTEKLLTYALGRGVEYYDKCTVDQIMQNLEQNDQFSTLVLGIVNSAPFQSRRNKE